MHPTTAMEAHVITGASSGIGREMALQLAAPGREIWLIGRDPGRLAQVATAVEEKGAAAHWIVLDLADTAAAKVFLTKNFPAEKPIHSLYLSAAVSLFGEVIDMQLDDWQHLYKINLLSPIQWAHHFYGHMVARRAGRIVLIASLASYAGYPTATAYATMKAGVLGLYRSLWYEGKTHGVQVHIAAPGYVQTGIYQSARYRRTSFEETMEQIKDMGFGLMAADKAAAEILAGMKRGQHEFAFPGYASLMKWIAPRMPWMISIVHNRILKNFRKAA